MALWVSGYERLDADQIKTLADLPSLDELRAKILGTIQAPAGKLVRTLRARLEPCPCYPGQVRRRIGDF